MTTLVSKEEVLREFDWYEKHAKIKGYFHHKALRKGIEDMKEENSWIPVEERLPEDNERVIVYDGFTYIGFYDDGFWYINEGIQCETIKFWQPLPKPPTVNGL